MQVREANTLVRVSALKQAKVMAQNADLLLERPANNTVGLFLFP